MTEAQFSKWGECQMPHGKADAIKLEDRTAELEAALREARSALDTQLNDCINFDGGKLTTCIMEASTKTIATIDKVLKP